MAAGLGMWAGFLGWKGLGLSAAGMIAAPVLIVLLHLGRTPGMGDIKLACGVGALLGPRLSLAAMLLAAAAGGIVALCSQLRAGTPITNAISVLFVGVPGLARWAHATPRTDAGPAVATVPYGVAIAAGSLLALAVFWCTGDEGWLL
jgi:Flp pilus assembly protein protease CpaA